MQDKAELALKHFKRLRKKLYRWRKYFRSNSFDGSTKLDTGVPPNEANSDGDPDAYFWCYSHYGDLTPDKLNGEYPDFEECLHVLGGARWGPRKGGDESLAYGDVVEPRPGIKNTLKERRGFGDGFVAATNPHPDDWKYFENEDEESKNVQKNAEFKKAQAVIEETTTLQNGDNELEKMQNEVDESESVRSEEVLEKVLNELRPRVAQAELVPTPLPLSLEQGFISPCSDFARSCQNGQRCNYSHLTKIEVSAQIEELQHIEKNCVGHFQLHKGSEVGKTYGTVRTVRAHEYLQNFNIHPIML